LFSSLIGVVSQFSISSLCSIEETIKIKIMSSSQSIDIMQLFCFLLTLLKSQQQI